MHNFGHVQNVEHKSKKDLVTNVDKESEAKIISIIREKFLDHAMGFAVAQKKITKRGIRKKKGIGFTLYMVASPGYKRWQKKSIKENQRALMETGFTKRI